MTEQTTLANIRAIEGQGLPTKDRLVREQAVRIIAGHKRASRLMQFVRSAHSTGTSAALVTLPDADAAIEHAIQVIDGAVAAYE